METFIAIISFSLISLMFTAWIWIGWITPELISKVKSKVELIKNLILY